jgi:chromosomal replication initiator protein
MHAWWEAVLEALGQRIGGDEVERWIRPLRPIGLTPTVLRLEAPNKFFIDCVNDHYFAALRESVAGAVGTRQILFEVNSRVQGELFPLRPRHGRRVDRRAAFGHLVSKYTFKNFVVGASNQFAHAASKAVATQPGEHYNPLFIYGGVGLGKTHLVNAIGHQVLERTPAAVVAFLSSEAFMNELIAALRRDRMDDFKGRFRHVDVLILDDVQLLADRERTQEEFFHTFNSLYETHRQIVLTSDTFPKDIPGLEERLRNRFEWGLIADMQPPDVETRIAILGKKAEAEGIALPHDVALFIASHIDSNVRELEGSLTRLGAYASLTKSPLTVEFAKDVLHDHLKHKTREAITADAIQQAVCVEFSLRPADLRSKRRSKDVAVPRQLAMYLCRKLLNASFPTIGNLFGGRDHSTVIHATAVTERRMKDDAGFQATVERLERVIQGR